MRSYPRQVHAEGTGMAALVVNFYAGPGTGKSTMAAHVFALLKWAGVRAELVTEFAKDCYWEQRPLPDAFYVMGKQHHRLARVAPYVDVVVTDSPLLMGLVYTDSPALRQLIRSYAGQFRNMHIRLERHKPYDPVGRWQSEPEAVALDAAITDMLDLYSVDYATYLATWAAARRICEYILSRLAREQHANQRKAYRL